MFPEIWKKVVSGNHQTQTAFVTGIARCKIIGDSYPVAYPCPGAPDLPGVLCFNVNKNDIAKLDTFEGQYYYRKTVTVYDLTGEAYTSNIYLLRRRYASLASKQAWDPEAFSSRDIRNFVRRYVANYHRKKQR